LRRKIGGKFWENSRARGDDARGNSGGIRRGSSDFERQNFDEFVGVGNFCGRGGQDFGGRGGGAGVAGDGAGGAEFGAGLGGRGRDDSAGNHDEVRSGAEEGNREFLAGEIFAGGKIGEIF